MAVHRWHYGLPFRSFFLMRTAAAARLTLGETDHPPLGSGSTQATLIDSAAKIGSTKQHPTVAFWREWINWIGFSSRWRQPTDGRDRWTVRSWRGHGAKTKCQFINGCRTEQSHSITIFGVCLQPSKASLTSTTLPRIVSKINDKPEKEISWGWTAKRIPTLGGDYMATERTYFD